MFTNLITSSGMARIVRRCQEQKSWQLPFAPLFPSLDTQTSVGTCTVPTQPPKIFNSTSHPHVLLWIIPLQQRPPQEFSPADAGPFLQQASMGPAVIMCLTYIFSSETAPSNTPLARAHKIATRLPVCKQPQ